MCHKLSQKKKKPGFTHILCVLKYMQTDVVRILNFNRFLKIIISGLFRIGHIALSDPRLCSTTFYILSSLKENEIKRLTGYSKRENYG